MVRLARGGAPGRPHHITHRGNRRQQTCFCAEDYQAYLALMGEGGRACAVEGWAYWLMPNHVHVMAVPDSDDGVRRASGDAHRRETWRVNFRQGWRARLWQGRFAACALDAPSLRAAARYSAQNPVRAGRAARPGEYPWSSVRAHVEGRGGSLVTAAPLLKRVDHWEAFLGMETSEEEIKRLRRYERTGRPLGSESFTGAGERHLRRTLRRGKPGPKGSRDS